ncbi:MAG TPA: O-antigen ligase family protein [Vicinamibacterales bacterium]|nr:O-antigen ligase family protein [Vicinamibacterales bacterium]
MSSLTLTAGESPRDRLEYGALIALLGFAAALQLSIAAADILLALCLTLWAASLVKRHERPAFPGMFWPLVAYAGFTLVSAAFSIDPRASFIDSRQLLLLLIVPAVYRLAEGTRALRVADVLITVGGVSAIAGVVQYGILDFDTLGRRPQGAMGHYMTYSGLLMLVVVTATARLLFRRSDRIWTALVMPALLVALSLTLTRSAWVGTFVGLAVLFSLRDFRMIAVLPIVAALFVALAPATVTDRVYSMFDVNDPSNRDRVAMVRSGARMVQDRPLTGVGPNMIPRVYAEYRDASAVNAMNPHLHNVPLQIAAERGLPALAAWVWFLVVAVRDLWRRFRATDMPSLAAGALAALASMLAAGFFEYNFGDSEFLMLLLVLVTLPYAADRARAAVEAPAPHPARQ